VIRYAAAAVGILLASALSMTSWRVWRVLFSKGYDAYRLRRRVLRPAAGDLRLVMTSDGKTIPCRVLAGHRPAVLVIAGGYRAQLEEFSTLARSLNDRGYSVVTFSWRGTAGDKERVTGGMREQLDLLAVIAAVRETYPHARLGVVGLSFGATMTLLAASQGREIDAMWLDGPFANPQRTMAHLVRRKLLFRASSVVIWPSIVALWLCTREWLPSLGVERATAKVRGIPVQLVVSETDISVPAGAVGALADIAGWTEDQFWFARDVGHIEAHRRRRREYVRRIDEFFAAALGAYSMSQRETTASDSSAAGGAVA